MAGQYLRKSCAMKTIRIPWSEVLARAPQRPVDYIATMRSAGKMDGDDLVLTLAVWNELIARFSASPVFSPESANIPVAVPIAQLESRAVGRPVGYLETLLGRARVETVDGVAIAYFEPAVWATLNNQFGEHAIFNPTSIPCCGQ